MNKRSLILVVLLAALLAIPFAIPRSKEPIPSVGTTAPADFAMHPHGALASSTDIYHTLVSPSGSYRVGVDATNVIRLVIPTDDRFLTPDGISTSSTLAEVRTVSHLPVIADGNFGYTVLLPSGWVARFDAADGAPSPNSIVASVFAR